MFDEDYEANEDTFYKRKRELEDDNARYFANENIRRQETLSKIDEKLKDIKKLRRQLMVPGTTPEQQKDIRWKIMVLDRTITQMLGHTPSLQELDMKVDVNDPAIREPQRQR